jgi:hypothetical protein
MRAGWTSRIKQTSTLLSSSLSSFRLGQSFRPCSVPVRSLSLFSESKGKAKELFQKYGSIFIGTYLSVYISTLSTIFLALETDIFSASDFGLDARTLTEMACEKIEYFTGIKSVPEFISKLSLSLSLLFVV